MDRNDIVSDLQKKQRGVLIGKNGVGKSFLINEIYEKNIENNIVFIMNSDVATSFELDNDNETSITRQLINLINQQYNEKLDNYSGDVLSNTRSKVNEINRNVKGNFYSDFNVELQFSKKNISPNELLKSLPKTDDGTGHKFYYILNFVCEILQWQLEETKKKRVLLLIDEPEKYSHPSLIIKTAKKLRQLSETNSFDVLVSTHSPLFVKYYVSDISQVYLMKNRNSIINNDVDYISNVIKQQYEGVLVSKFNSSKKLVASEMLIKNYINKVVLGNILESLFCDISVILEGYSDRVFVDYMILNTDFNFDFHPLAANGKGMIPFFINIMKLYSIPVFSFYDEDTSKAGEKHRVYNNYIRQNSDGSFTFSENIEDYFGIDDKRQKQTYSSSEVARMLINKNMVNKKTAIEHLINDFKSALKRTFDQVIMNQSTVLDKVTHLISLLQEYAPLQENERVYKDIYSTTISIYKTGDELADEIKSDIQNITNSRLAVFCDKNDIDFDSLIKNDNTTYIKDATFILFASLVSSDPGLAKKVYDSFLMTPSKFMFVNESYEDIFSIGVNSVVAVQKDIFLQKYKDKPRLLKQIHDNLVDEYVYSGKIDMDSIEKEINFKVDDDFGFREIKHLRDEFLLDLNNYLKTYY